VAPVDALSYEELRRRQQLERRSPRLTQLPSDFYRNLDLYLRGLLEDYLREHGKDPTSARATLLGDELANTRRLAEDLYEQRERKLLSAALAAARGGHPELQHLLGPERQLYDGLASLLREARERALHAPFAAREVPAAAAPASGAPPPPTAGATTAGPPLPQLAPAPEEAPVSARVLVRVLEDVGAFTGTDLREYHVLREDVVSLPRMVAETLIVRGKAVEVQPSL